jgi:peptide/nickel transport system permease protein
VGTSIVILIGISIFIFVLLHAVFPSPAIVVLGPRASPVAVSAWNAANGFDAPVIVQYWHYLIGVLHGNLGYSYKLNQSVAALFGERWARSAYLSGAGLVLAVLIAIPLGIYQAVKRNSVGDNVATGLAFMAYAMPDFLLYLIAVQVFALTFHIFGFEASQSNSIISIIGDWPQSFRASEVELLIVLMPGFGSGVGLLSAAGRAAVPGMPGCAPAPTAPG